MVELNGIEPMTTWCDAALECLHMTGYLLLFYDGRHYRGCRQQRPGIGV
jgi:hypothetical protein